MSECIALIPARGGSKGLPGKNIAPLAGRPLIAHGIRAALDAGLTRVIVSTDDEAIAAVAREHGAQVPFMRPDVLATDVATSVAVVHHAIEALSLDGRDSICFLQPTSPLRSAQDIRDALTMHRRTGEPVVSMVESDKPLAWYFEVGDDGRLSQRFPELAIGRRQDEEALLLPNGAIYLGTCSQWLRVTQSLIPGALPMRMPASRSVDIDSARDIWLAEQWLAKGDQ